ncbi:MAG: GntR family transcriptional regulator [Pseudomonadota bacterium]
MRKTQQTGNARTSLRAPLYHRIYLILRQQILDGTYPYGAMLPGENDLSAQYNVSRITAQRALNELAADRLAERARGRGTFARPPEAMVPVEAKAEGLFENLLAMGLKTDARVLAFDYRTAPEDVRHHLGLPGKSEVQRAVRLRSQDGVPISYLTTWVPGDIGRTYSEAELGKEPLLALLQRADITVHSADQTITACLADADIAPLLETEVGAPLLRLSRIVRDRADRPVEWLIALYRPDRYQHRMRLELTRDSDGPALWAPVAAAE